MDEPSGNKDDDDHTNERRDRTEARLQQTKPTIGLKFGEKSGPQLVKEWRRRKKKWPAPEP